jgi:hypothetical protein
VFDLPTPTGVCGIVVNEGKLFVVFIVFLVKLLTTVGPILFSLIYTLLAV